MENIYKEHIQNALDGIEKLYDLNGVIGEPIETPSGVTVIPITKLSAGIASGGVDYDTAKRFNKKTSGGGGGTGISIAPIAFLTVNANAEVKLIPVSDSSSIDKLASVIEHTPEIIERFRDALS